MSIRTGWILALLVFSGALPSSAESGGLKTIDNPGGGQIVYGPLTNTTSLRDAMAAMLRNVHTHFGDKPAVGKFFQTKGSGSVAAFFTVTAKTQGNKPIAGMVIVSMPSKSTAAAAVLYDDAGRFGKTQPVLMKKLNQAWQQDTPRQVSSSANVTASEARPQPLHPAAVGDNSASVGLPEGWHITGGGGGTVHAAGPNGEAVHLGILIQNIYDPRNPASRSMIQYLNRGSTEYFVCSPADLVAAWRCVAQQSGQRQHKPVPTLTTTSVQPVQPNQYEVQEILVAGELDRHDGKGPLTVSIRMGAMKEGPQGGWPLGLTGVEVPQQLAQKEWPTMKAILASYRQNGQVIQAQTNQVIANINATADANRKIADERSRENDQHNRDVEARWDDQAKANKAFENYTLDRSVVQDNDIPAHGTFDYPTADALVKSDPTRFQYVPTQDLLKGIDY
jgi:hypothetical protein